MLLSNNNLNISFSLQTSAFRCLSVTENERATKLYRQFAHASKEKLCKVVKESKDFDEQELKKKPLKNAAILVIYT